MFKLKFGAVERYVFCCRCFTCICGVAIEEVESEVGIGSQLAA